MQPDTLMEIANGTEPDGITYRAYLSAPKWVIEVRHPDGRMLTEQFHWTFEPRCGPDAADTAECCSRMETMINELRKT